MKNFTKFLCLGLSLLLFIIVTENAYASKAKYIFKVASLAPEGSVWAKRFRDFTDEVTEKSDGEIGFKIYAGGVMGDDRAMYRKMRVGQLNGGGFTMTGISEIVPDFRVLGIPFLFNINIYVLDAKVLFHQQAANALQYQGIKDPALLRAGVVTYVDTSFRPMTHEFFIFRVEYVSHIDHHST